MPSVLTELLKQSKRVLALGIPKLDEALQGFQRGDFSVLFGRPLCTMLPFILSVQCQLPYRKGGLNSRVIYVDGGNTFDPYAVSTIAQEYGLEPRSVLEKILVSRAFTAYQLTALVFEKLNETLKLSRSKLVVVSDVTGLFLDRDVPEIEGREIFLRMTRHLSEVASTRQAIVVASYLPRPYSRRNVFLESVLLARASNVIGYKKSECGFKFVLEKHCDMSAGSSIFNSPSNLVTMDMFMEA